jgi:hypothetical protein
LADPWMKFYTSDWRADPRLKMCSPAARGMWIEMICLMHEATPYGHLLVHGQTPNVAQLASLTGIPTAELPDLIGELERLGVFSRTREGVIYSRKLVRMEAKAAVARKNGKYGGNPSLRKDTENSASVNPMDNGGHKPQKPEARSQKVERGKPLSCATERFQEFWDQYPHRNGAKKGRDKAEASWSRHIKAGTAPSDIIAGALRYATDRQVLNGYAKDPTTWLNGKGWKDEIEPSAADGRNYDPRPDSPGPGTPPQRGAGGPHDGMVAAFAHVANRQPH